MKDEEFPRVRRSMHGKFLDEFEGTKRDLKVLFVNNDTNIYVDFKNLEREISQNTGRNFRQKGVKLFGMEYTMHPQKLFGTTEL